MSGCLASRVWFRDSRFQVSGLGDAKSKYQFGGSGISGLRYSKPW